MDVEIVKNKLKNNKLLYHIALIPWLPIRLVKYCKKKRLDRKILNENKLRLKKFPVKENDILYFGVPYQLNAGDMAQTYCTRNWLKENYPGREIHEFNTAALLDESFLHTLKEQSTSSNMIFFQSGYTSHEKHRDHGMHKAVVQLFSNNKIIFMPQTVNITTDAELNRTAKIFGSHAHLLFLARDRISYEMVERIFVSSGVNLLLYPDIVNILVGADAFQAGGDSRNGVLMVIRNDSEKYYGTQIIHRIQNELFCMGEEVEITDTTLSDIDYDSFYTDFESVFSSLIQKWASAKIVITDRYHGTIFAAIANTPVIVLATNDHKVKGGYEWFAKEGYSSVYYADSPDKAIKLTKAFLDDYITAQNSDDFKNKYYDRLKRKIEIL